MNLTIYKISLYNESHRETNLNETDEIIPYKERPETYFVPILFFIIFVVGVVGNGTLVAIFIRHKNMRNVPNMYILSLALADLLVILTSVPFTSIVYTMESWPWGELICKISEFAKDISIGVSVFTLTALSADRFFAIVDPLKKFHTSSGGRRATRITVCIAVSIWILAIICAIPAALASHIKGIPDKSPKFFVCYPFPDWFNKSYPQMMVASRFLILYVIPLTIIGIFYLSMAVSLITSTRNVPGEMQGMHRQIRARKKVAVTVLVFVAVFAVCFAPIHAFMMFFYFHPRSLDVYNAFWHYLRIVGFCLCYINSCANPIALYFVSAAFRKYFNRYLLCRNLKRSQSYHHRGTSISLVSLKRNQSMMGSRKKKLSNIRRADPLMVQETSVTLLAVGNDHMCNDI
ncbi:neuropeptide CCHamide-1 receptor [Diorhabda carinulata]|uniref:neuropeptide CCHamide-1 receptor n=1 Tax=Diorhabda carinulata TaxID=1163345 RepID=UPI0025A006C2|nr:neuropeptide CCHamide-1 receptor [Diorhabda carinulata]XP_057652477.1 neuropeptide CCHamide-1 receptor [Diorhabda carinulata]